MRLLLLGDSHGFADHIDFAYDKAERFSCDAVFVLGDFGWWPKWKDGKEFIKYCCLRAQSSEIPLYFLDGNHEDYSSLDVHVAEHGRDAFIQLAPKFFYSPRGNTWEWGGVKFATLGGAYSIDCLDRTLGLDWFPQELISPEDVDYCLELSPVDVLLTHDAPIQVDMAAHMMAAGRNWIKGDPTTIANRVELQKVVDHLQPSVLLHGHWHLSYREKLLNGPKVVGLNCNFKPSQSWTVLDTDDF